MQGIEIQLDRQDKAYIPGEPITGRVSWDLSDAPKRITVRLIWQTSGKGTQDVGEVGETVFDVVSLRETREFSFPGVDGPYSFSGKLITLAWSVQAEANSGDGFAQQSLVVSPTGTEVVPLAAEEKL